MGTLSAVSDQGGLFFFPEGGETVFCFAFVFLCFIQSGSDEAIISRTFTVHFIPTLPL